MGGGRRPPQDDEMMANLTPLNSNTTRELVARLNDPDSLVRGRARMALVQQGETAVPALVAALSASQARVRWEATEALADLHAVAAATTLVDLLQDDNLDVRWAASRALIALNRDALPPLLTALTQHFDSVWLRRGAYHVLHSLKLRGVLHDKEVRLLQALSSVLPLFGVGTAYDDVPWLAQEALLALPRRES